MPTRVTNIFLLLLLIGSLAREGSGREFSRFSYICEVGASQEDVFTPARPLPMKDDLSFSVILDNARLSEPLTTGFRYIPHARTGTTSLAGSFDEALW